MGRDLDIISGPRSRGIVNAGSPDGRDGALFQHAVIQAQQKGAVGQPQPPQGGTHTSTDIGVMRTEIAGEMRGTTDEVRLRVLITQELDIATMTLATPEDRLDDIKREIIARKPGDARFATLVEEQAEIARQDWRTQGRSHEVFDELVAAYKTGDMRKVEELLLRQYVSVAATDARPQAITDHRDTLLAYGPAEQQFRDLVMGGTEKFLNGRIDQAVNEIEAAYKQGGAEKPLSRAKAAAKLRELTDPETTDPYTAGQIFIRSQARIDDLAEAFKANPQAGGVPTYGSAIFADLNAASDSAARSPEGKDAVMTLAGKIGSDAYPYVHAVGTSRTVGNGDGALLPLAIAASLKDKGDTYHANLLLKDIVTGTEKLRANTRESVQALSDAANPLIEPVRAWEHAVGEESDGSLSRAQAERWVDANPHVVDDIEKQWKQVNRDGYELNRTTGALQEYAGRFDGLENKQKIIDLGTLPPVDKDWELNFAYAQSPASLTESLRRDTIDLLRNEGESGATTTTPDPSWSLRAYRNFAQKVAPKQRLAVEGKLGVGLNLYGTGTYLWGIANHGGELLEKAQRYGLVDAMLSQSGWRNAGFTVLYGGGVFIEGHDAAARFRGSDAAKSLAQKAPLKGSPVAKLLNTKGTPFSRTVFVRHLKLFGWWNVIGTVEYFAKGQIARTGALGLAAGGTLLSTYFSASWTGPVGAGAVVIGSTALYVMDRMEERDTANVTEGYQETFLRQNGIRPEIAKHLANNDSDGRPVGAAIDQYAAHLGVTPGALLEWLNKQDPAWVEDFVQNGLHQIDRNDDGTFKAQGLEGDGRDAGKVWGLLDWTGHFEEGLTQPSTLEELERWCELTGHAPPTK